jgi:tRNA A37 threonylcarbamoyladenosine dehydratase
MTKKEAGIFSRTELLMGSEFMRRMGEVRVIVLGVGGVGSWCVESLVRSGIGQITLVDCDVVSVTNVNRQLMATSKTVGMAKVEVLKQRLLDINPRVEVTCLQKVFQKENAEEFHLETYDYIVDAIDSLKDKLSLILHATRLMKECPHINFFSSMGAALRTDPFAISKAEFWEVTGDPLARMLRKRFKSMKEYPAHKFTCVYSTELPRENMGDEVEEVAPADLGAKARINGTMAHVTIMFGTALAGLVVNDIEKRMRAQKA